MYANQSFYFFPSVISPPLLLTHLIFYYYSDPVKEQKRFSDAASFIAILNFVYFALANMDGFRKLISEQIKLDKCGAGVAGM